MFSSEARSRSRIQGSLVSQVLGLLAFSTLFTAGGAALVPVLGAPAFIAGAAGGLVTLLVLIFVRPLPGSIRLGLFYLFSTFEGLFLGVVIQAYLAAGLGNIVVLAAGTTGALVLTLSAYAWTTRHDLSSLGSYLFVGLVGVLIASVIGVFVRAPLFHIAVASVSAILFCGYILYDVQRLKRADANADPIMLAIDIYLDVLNLFLDLLRILAYLSSDDD